MTTKQIYSELAKIAGARCVSGETFVRAALVSEAELRKVQRSILALLDKLNYARTVRDFRMTPGYETRMRELDESERRLRMTTEQQERVANLSSRLREVPFPVPIDPWNEPSPASPGTTESLRDYGRINSSVAGITMGVPFYGSSLLTGTGPLQTEQVGIPDQPPPDGRIRLD